MSEQNDKNKEYVDNHRRQWLDSSLSNFHVLPEFNKEWISAQGLLSIKERLELRRLWLVYVDRKRMKMLLLEDHLHG